MEHCKDLGNTDISGASGDYAVPDKSKSERKRKKTRRKLPKGRHRIGGRGGEREIPPKVSRRNEQPTGNAASWE